MNGLSRDYATILADLRALVLSSRPDEINSFFDGDVARIIADMIAYQGSSFTFSVNRATEEMFLTTCRTLDAALRHCAGVGYVTATSTAASTVLVPASFAAIPRELTVNTSVNEQQSITLSRIPNTGTYTLTFGGQTTTPLPYGISGPDLQVALESLSSIGTGNIAVNALWVPDKVSWLLTFKGTLGFTNLGPVTINAASVFRNEIQRVTLTGNPTLGSMTLSLAGSASLAFAPTASAATVRSSLEAIPAIGVGNVEVTGGPGPVTPWTIMFKGTLAGTSQPLLVATPSFSNGTAPAVSVQRIDDGGAITGTVAQVVDGSLGSSTAFIAKGSQVSLNGKNWEVSEDVTVKGQLVTADTFESVFRVPVIEGTSRTETFVSTGGTFQSYTTDSTNVADGSVVVRVGDPSSAPWTLIDLLAASAPDANVYSVRYTSEGRAIITFGNGLQGRIPALSQRIFVTLRSTQGEEGNAAAKSITGSIPFTATSPIGTQTTTSVKMTNVVAASGGRAPETLEELKVNVPAFIRTVNKAITREDYETLGKQFSSENGTVAACVAFIEDSAVLFQTSGPPIDADNPLIVTESTPITIGSRVFRATRNFRTVQPDPLLSVNVNVVNVRAWSKTATGFVGSSQPLCDDLRNSLYEKGVVTTVVRCQPGKVVDVSINLGEVLVAQNSVLSAIDAAIRDAVLAVFLSYTPGVAVYVSDIYEAVEAVDRVVSLKVVTPADDVIVAPDAIAVLRQLQFTLRRETGTIPPSPNDIFRGDTLY